MIESHRSVEIDKFASDVKNALQRTSDVEEYQNLGEISDLSAIGSAVVYATVVSVYIKEDSYRSQSDRATITKAVYIALAENTRCKDIFSLGNYIIGIFNSPFKSDIDSALDSVGKVKALFNLVNKVYGQSLQSPLTCGIGMSYGKVLMIKSLDGERPQYAWSGEAVSDATRLSEKASVEDRVCASFSIYNNLKEDYQKLFSKALLEGHYEATPVNIAMNKWINANV